VLPSSSFLQRIPEESFTPRISGALDVDIIDQPLKPEIGFFKLIFAGKRNFLEKVAQPFDVSSSRKIREK